MLLYDSTSIIVLKLLRQDCKTHYIFLFQFVKNKYVDVYKIKYSMNLLENLKKKRKLTVLALCMVCLQMALFPFGSLILL